MKKVINIKNTVDLAIISTDIPVEVHMEYGKIKFFNIGIFRERTDKGFLMITPVFTEKGERLGECEYNYDKFTDSFFLGKDHRYIEEGSEKYKKYFSKLTELCIK